MSRLSSRMKISYYPFLVKRDGNRCFYCMESFSDQNTYEYDHLNNNPKDSRPENLVLSHHSCNVKKKYSELWLEKALGKIRINESSKYVCGVQADHIGIEEPLTSSQRINKTLTEVTKIFLNEHTMNNQSIPLTDSVCAIANICQENHNCGSLNSLYRIIKILSNSINGSYQVVSKNGQNFIQKRVN